MRSTEKESVISQFRNKELQILVSTAVIEVGIDIPNATVMMVEGAERFGLSQLHQYRGRVGRGKSDSYCILVSDSESPEVRERLNILETTTNGFTLSEADLQMRGPGEFFGTKQSGIPDLSLTWLSNLDLIEKVRSQASTILDADPQLNKNAHKKLNKELNRFWERAKETPEGG
jgi:ATP-dependent DNA helicase RecG